MYHIYEKLRDARGVTDYRVAKDTGLSSSTLADWKTGRHAPSLETLRKLAKYFGVTVDFLIGSEVT